MKDHLFFAFLAAFLSVSLLSCGGTAHVYPGPARGAQEIATFVGHGVTLVRVDKQPIGSSSTSVALLPGKHDLVVKSDPSSYGLLNEGRQLALIPVAAEAGKSYIITSKRGGRRLCAFEEEETTGKPNFLKSAGCFESYVRR